ncbi:hypothetical protein [Actinomadura harenae]|uniref:Uncharacterized protein n=1 Tax=Actinomadura harenae TaxID=2483351 RepID=A0A3M2LNV8_9ACTN|nr:hypothetical protein [Actinomadura harenae]RMI37775.1 hypothetical protein EBO15_34905 [Actinomadura harenae]
MHRSIVRPALAAALATAALATAGTALATPPVAAAPSDVTGRQCVDGGGTIMGDDPLPLGWCIGGKYDGQPITDK